MTSIAERFAAKYMPVTESGCWLWLGPHMSQGGYGCFRFDGKNHYAHRAAWELAYGSIPSGLHVCHRCDVPLCVNPAHLFLGTPGDNVRDCRTKGRTRNQNTLKTHCKNRHQLIGLNLYVQPSGKRRCRTCRLEDQRKSYAAHPERHRAYTKHYNATHREEVRRKGREAARQKRRRHGDEVRQRDRERYRRNRIKRFADRGARR